MSPVGKIADLLLTQIAPKAKAQAADTYTEYSCLYPPNSPGCGWQGYLEYRVCGDSWCGSWHFLQCGC